MGTHRGTHGTSGQRADAIEAKGFAASAVGKAGSGVYLWAYADDSSTARDLAIGWYKNQLGWRAFADEKDPKWAVLYAEIEAADEECYDCNTLEFREALFAYLRALDRADVAYSDDDLCGAYNSLIKRIEAKVQRNFGVVHACVPLPKKMPLKEKVAGSDAFVHIVRQGFDRLRVTAREDEAVSGGDVKEAEAVGR
ncbi:hypothetical protein [Burkholderia lata]|uniref:hypothetical protein n=1 Tax=Burkholderia lata (strain ATCC 17760 / DSM 23089 / LMG 22485 / NCIMB 9086 / R18194 / 383) TaxID=482957 RepID=UPI0014542BB0|nr:hypothetical protein [Burkholderia lata]VWB73835.1 hypothetical protein BLA15816_03507 [Burkholderia lata]